MLQTPPVASGRTPEIGGQLAVLGFTIIYNMTASGLSLFLGALGSQERKRPGTAIPRRLLVLGQVSQDRAAPRKRALLEDGARERYTPKNQVT